MRPLADRSDRRDREFVLAPLVQILGLVAGLIRRQGSPVPLALRAADVHVVGRDVAVALQGRLPGDDDGRGRADDRLDGGRHLRQVLLGHAVERRRGDAVAGSGVRQDLDRIVGVLLQAVEHHRQRGGDLHLRLDGLRQRVRVLPHDLVALQNPVQAGVGRGFPGDLQGHRRERGATHVLRRAARN